MVKVGGQEPPTRKCKGLGRRGSPFMFTLTHYYTNRLINGIIMSFIGINRLTGGVGGGAGGKAAVQVPGPGPLPSIERMPIIICLMLSIKRQWHELTDSCN